ncbi:hypothetical protein V5740_09970 [Croceibacterium sp. TMG7-5b_MA50]|uniref:hypothetical protein n=1 Tax=Croceibacterium sp. TMG7-5b_MA50 TaxID=3121290 RepID=UPI00322213BF
MRKIALFAAAPLLAALAACGSSDDASEDAIADTVEMPADQAMTEAPMPAPDAGITAPEPAIDAGAPVEDDVDTTAAAADAAEAAVADIESEAAAAEAATQAAESSM